MPESPQARIIETVRTKCIIFGEALKIRGQNINKIFLKIVQKALKRPITVCKFSKIFRGSMPPDPPRVVFVT